MYTLPIYVQWSYFCPGIPLSSNFGWHFTYRFLQKIFGHIFKQILEVTLMNLLFWTFNDQLNSQIGLTIPYLLGTPAETWSNTRQAGQLPRWNWQGWERQTYDGWRQIIQGRATGNSESIYSFYPFIDCKTSLNLPKKIFLVNPTLAAIFFIFSNNFRNLDNF